MLTLGFLGKLFGKRKDDKTDGEAGVKAKPDCDSIHMPLKCPRCAEIVSEITPERGLARCACGHIFAVIDFEAKPLPKDFRFD